MRAPNDANDVPVAIRLGRGPGMGPWGIAAGLVAVVTLGALGRLVPPPAATAAAPTVVPTPAQEVQLVNPSGNVLYRRTTEVSVRGTAPLGIAEVEVAILIGAESIGETRLDVDARGRFGGVVSIIPPKARSIAFLEVRDPASQDRVLGGVSFAVQAGASILPRDPSLLRGTAGTTLVVDVLAYVPIGEMRGLLTSVDGKLIAESSLLAPPRNGSTFPHTIGLTIEIPVERLPERARLHIVAIDRAGMELEHIDANVALSND